LEHVLIDTSIYRADPKRSKPAFRALSRLARAGSVQIHIPKYVREEFLSQQSYAIGKQTAAIRAAADAILRSTSEANLRTYAENTVQMIAKIEQGVREWTTNEFQAWITECRVREYPIQPDHGQRVTEAYFGGVAPFRAPKHRDDFPDAFIWQAALDLVQEHGELSVVSADGGLRDAADKHADMLAYKTLDEFIQTGACQDALDDLSPEIVAENVERVKALLPSAKDQLVHRLAIGIVNALAGRTVRHPAIPDDNNEATILMVGEPERVDLGFDQIDEYGDGEVGVPFKANVDCTLNYAIYKADYYALNDAEDISIGERNRHYFDAEQDYSITVEGTISISIGTEELGNDRLSDEDLEDLINDADYSIDVDETTVSVPYW